VTLPGGANGVFALLRDAGVVEDSGHERLLASQGRQHLGFQHRLAAARALAGTPAPEA